jgi:hypothetical protein
VKSLLRASIFALYALAAFAQNGPVITIRTQGPLTNQDVIDMTRSKFSDSVIEKAIQANRGDFDVSVGALMRLRSAGVSQPVIETILSAATSRQAGPAASTIVPTTEAKSDFQAAEKQARADPDLPEDVGIYLREQGKLVAIEPEVVNWRTGGVLKATATLGFDKGHVNGTIPGPHSALILSWSRQGLGGPLEFYIRCQEGNSASEYQFLRLWDKGDRREFRSVTGGILHRSGGAQLNELAFKYEKVAPRIYKIQIVKLDAGEYGFLAPGAIGSSNAASLGKIYTFRVPD